MEIERKFLINEGAYEYDAFPYKVIEQGYLSTKPVVRVRKEDDKYYLTYKGAGMMARDEYNLPLTEESYNHLKTKIDGHLVSKNRFIIPYYQYTIELDEFMGDLAPLLMAEVEFTSVEEALAFTPPEWFGKEVTEDPNYANSKLSTK